MDVFSQAEPGMPGCAGRFPVTALVQAEHLRTVGLRHEGVMNIRWLWVPALFFLPFGGCRRDPYMQVYLDNLNAEKRMLEDRVYELEYNYEQKLQELEAARGGKSPEDRGESRLRDSSSAGSGRRKGDLPPGIPDLSPPSVDPGTPAGDGQKPGNDDELGPLQLEMGEEAEKINTKPPPVPDDANITHLYLNPALTGGDEVDDTPGDDGVSVVFEPRNAQNQYVPVPGRVSVVLLDPTTRSRVARWDFQPDEVALAMQRARSGRGIRLRMPWQEQPPDRPRLHMFVRYWTSDGTPVEADRQITITPSNHLASRWTPRSPERPRTPVKVAENPGDPENSAGLGKPLKDQDAQPADQAKQAQRPQWRPNR